MSNANHTFSSVYGPVNSWRFGRSLGIDPIGLISTCSFNCVYCQLGEIQRQSSDRELFISTEQIQRDLANFIPWEIDVVTVSGSGEPTLALNLGEILAMAKTFTQKPTAVLTNGSLLTNAQVRADLAVADHVSVKIDAISPNRFQRINRPIAGVEPWEIWAGLQHLRQEYQGILAIQTMLLSPWNEQEQADYIALLQELMPDEVQLNTPTRPKPLTPAVDARGNHTSTERAYPVQSLKPVAQEVLQTFGDRIRVATGIPVRHPNVPLTTQQPMVVHRRVELEV